jgi:ankyrin repeat protein
VDVNTTGRGALGNTPLMWACLRGQPAIVSELLAAFPMLDVHAKNKAGSTALDIARELKLLKIARLLEARTESDCWRDR